MKFKRNGLYIEVLVLVTIIIFVSLFFMVKLYNAGKDVVLFCLGIVLWLALVLEICIRGLFYDTVYCDEKGIKVVMRKKISEYTWDELYRIEKISSRTGTIGWTVISITGEKFQIFPFSAIAKKFFNFMKSNLPNYIEIK